MLFQCTYKLVFFQQAWLSSKLCSKPQLLLLAQMMLQQTPVQMAHVVKEQDVAWFMLEQFPEVVFSLWTYTHSDINVFLRNNFPSIPRVLWTWKTLQIYCQIWRGLSGCCKLHRPWFGGARLWDELCVRASSLDRWWRPSVLIHREEWQEVLWKETSKLSRTKCYTLSFQWAQLWILVRKRVASKRQGIQGIKGTQTIVLRESRPLCRNV